VRWRGYEFRRQVDAIKFWAAFAGQRLVGDDFHFIETAARTADARSAGEIVRQAASSVIGLSGSAISEVS
jgi:hypothetical protein